MKRTAIKTGTKSLARGSTFFGERKPMKRTKAQRIPPRPKWARGFEAKQAQAFRAAVSWRECCVCGSPWFIHAHHVIYRQHCPPGMEWDPRNSLGVCRGCHERHHSGFRPILRRYLTDANWEFARELGLSWRLERTYPDGSQGSSIQTSSGAGVLEHPAPDHPDNGGSE